jgi:hypothetical protein
MQRTALRGGFEHLDLPRWRAAFTAACSGPGVIRFDSSFDFVIAFVLSEGPAPSRGTPSPCSSLCTQTARNTSSRDARAKRVGIA